MKKFLGVVLGLCIAMTTAFGANFPQNFQNYLKKNIADVDIRFDGMIICPDGAMYMPLLPASMKKPDKIEVTETYPSNKPISARPDVIIFNNDYVLLKLIPAPDGKRTVMKFDKTPNVVKTGLLPQDMLVPKGLIIPENLKGIVGNLNIELSPEVDIKVAPNTLLPTRTNEVNKNLKKLSNTSTINELKNKTLYMVSSYTKNISVVNGEQLKADYALAQASTPIDAKLTPDNKFMLVTAYDSTVVNIISLADDIIIKQLDLTCQGGEILIDNEANKAYIMCPEVSTIYVLDLNKMTLVKRIKINGRCEKPVLYNNTIVYLDKLSDTVWSVELGGDYQLKNFGQFPNISKILYENDTIFLCSRTKNRVAVLSYKEKKLLSEFEVVEKPIDMMIRNDLLYVLGAENNEVQVFDIARLEPLTTLKIAKDGFATKFSPVPDSDLVLITDTKIGQYAVLDTINLKILKINGTEVPVNDIVIGKKVKKIN